VVDDERLDAEISSSAHRTAIDRITTPRIFLFGTVRVDVTSRPDGLH